MARVAKLTAGMPEPSSRIGNRVADGPCDGEMRASSIQRGADAGCASADNIAPRLLAIGISGKRDMPEEI